VLTFGKKIDEENVQICLDQTSLHNPWLEVIIHHISLKIKYNDG
jgi:hypothetical protein